MELFANDDEVVANGRSLRVVTKEWIQDFRDGLSIMEGYGLTEGFGHLSVRLSDGSIAITPARGPGMAAAEGLHASFSTEGERLDETDLPAPLETPMHLAVYRNRKDVNSICRTHSPFAVSYGVMGKPLRSFHGFGLMLGEFVPYCSEGDLISDEEKGAVVASALGNSGGLLLKGNGALVVGESSVRAVVRAIYLEETARIAIHAGACEKEKWSETEIVDRSRWHGAELARAWEYYRWKYCG